MARSKDASPSTLPPLVHPDTFVLTANEAAEVHVFYGRVLSNVEVQLRGIDCYLSFDLSPAAARELAAMLVAEAERREQHSIEHAKMLASMTAERASTRRRSS